MVVQRLAKPSSSNAVQIRPLLSALRGISMLNDDIAMFYEHATPGGCRTDANRAGTWLHSQAVKTPPLHGGDLGSTPGGVIGIYGLLQLSARPLPTA